jgi:DNA-binding NarL/FixJ family response regulator
LPSSTTCYSAREFAPWLIRSAARSRSCAAGPRCYLVIFDLDREALDPLSAVREIKAQPDLAHVFTVGFVSHVHTDTIEAARHAGIDLVLARSAFVGRLPQLLASAGHPTTGQP